MSQRIAIRKVLIRLNLQWKSGWGDFDIPLVEEKMSLQGIREIYNRDGGVDSKAIGLAGLTESVDDKQDVEDMKVRHGTIALFPKGGRGVERGGAGGHVLGGEPPAPQPPGSRAGSSQLCRQDKNTNSSITCVPSTEVSSSVSRSARVTWE